MALRMELKPEVEAWIKAQSQARGISVGAFVESVIQDGFNGTSGEDDPRVSATREAVSDDLFLADLAETMEDFKYADCERNH